MKLVLSIVLICFFALMSIWLFVAIVQGVMYIIYQRTDRIYLSRSARCHSKECYFTLEFNGEEIDKVFAYTKINKSYYVLGIDVIYKIKGNRLETVDVSSLQREEASIIKQMKKACYAKVIKDQELLQLFLADKDLGDT